MIKFSIPIEPVAKGRPRFHNTGQYVKTYTPKKTRVYENLVAAIATQNAPDEPWERTVPLYISINVYRSIPKSWSKKKRNCAIAGSLLPTTRPDLDNYEKAISDALDKTGKFFADDSQICISMTRKYYSDEPRIDVEIGEI